MSYLNTGPWSLKFTKDLGVEAKAKDLEFKAKTKDSEFKARDLEIKAKAKLQLSIKNLGVYLDSRMFSDSQVSETCKASYFHIRALRHIRSSLTTEACKTIAAAIVGSRLDYCNSLLAGTSVSNLARLQLFSKYTCPGRYWKFSFLPHHTRSLWVALAFCSPQPLQFQQPSYLAALIPRYVPTDNTITAIFFFIVPMCS